MTPPIKQISLPADYQESVSVIKERIRSAQYEALRKVNKELIALYWDLGEMISARQEGDSWGRAVIEQLARELQAEFPGTKGFSASNLWRMKGFFQAYENDEKLAPLVREIGWSHNLVILERCKDTQQRQFYILMTKKYGWSKNVLAKQIDSQTFEKTLLNQTNFDQTVPSKIRNQAKLAVKDEYSFGFLELGDEFSERDLEAAILPCNIR